MQPQLNAPPVISFVASDDGVEVAVHDYGGSGLPVVFVHGTGFVSPLWGPVIRRLPSGLHAYGVDLRGHGAARAPADVEFHDHRMVADLTAVCRALGIRNGGAVGHSMGGGTALLTEATHPGTFARLWVYEPVIFPRTTTNNPTALVQGTLRRRPGFASRSAASLRYGSRPPLQELHPEVLAEYIEHGFVDGPDGSALLICTPELEARAYEQYLAEGFSRLGEIRPPVKVGYGTATEEPSGVWSPAVAQALPRGEVEVYDNCLHLGCFADLDRTASSIAAWFSCLVEGFGV